MHELGLIHCDLKPENILIKSYKGCEMKVIDLGSTCFKRQLMPIVLSPSYSAPEVILGLPYDQQLTFGLLGVFWLGYALGKCFFQMIHL